RLAAGKSGLCEAKRDIAHVQRERGNRFDGRADFVASGIGRRFHNGRCRCLSLLKRVRLYCGKGGEVLRGRRSSCRSLRTPLELEGVVAIGANAPTRRLLRIGEVEVIEKVLRRGAGR